MVQKKVILQDGETNLLPQTTIDNIFDKDGKKKWQSPNFENTFDLPFKSDYEFNKHRFYLKDNELYFLTKSDGMITKLDNPLSSVGTTQYFRARCVYNNKIYFFINNISYFYDISKKQYTKLNIGSFSAAASTKDCLINGKMYLLGGEKSYEFDPSNNSFKVIGSSLFGSSPDIQGVFAYKDKMYIMSCNYGSLNSQTMYSFDVTTNKATEFLKRDNWFPDDYTIIGNLVYVLSNNSVLSINMETKEVIKYPFTNGINRNDGSVGIFTIEGKPCVFHQNYSTNLITLEIIDIAKETITQRFIPASSYLRLMNGIQNGSNIYSMNEGLGFFDINANQIYDWYKLTPTKVE